jgi:hypothetical protein
MTDTMQSETDEVLREICVLLEAHNPNHIAITEETAWRRWMSS